MPWPRLAHVGLTSMPFPKQHSGAKAPKGGVDEPADGCCFFCGLQVDQDEQFIQGDS